MRHRYFMAPSVRLNNVGRRAACGREVVEGERCKSTGGSDGDEAVFEGGCRVAFKGQDTGDSRRLGGSSIHWRVGGGRRWPCLHSLVGSQAAELVHGVP